MDSRRFSRNQGYVTLEQQERLSRTRVLIAGCGMGSFAAEALLRLGVGHLRLVDGDEVEGHNLNRQDYVSADIGRSKARMLERRLQTIFPEASVETVPEYLCVENSGRLLNGIDLVVDTIDFLDLVNIVRLHDGASEARLPVISAMTVGWGALAVVLRPRPGARSWFRELFSIEKDEVVRNESYGQKYRSLFERIGPYLDPSVIQATKGIFTIMENGKPCPAPALAAGTLSAAALVSTLVFRVAVGLPVTEAPEAVLVDLMGQGTSRGISLL